MLVLAAVSYTHLDVYKRQPLYGSLKGTTAVMFSNTANVPAKLIKDKAKDGIPGLKAA